VKVVIAGGTGGLGRRLADDVASRGDDVVILTRSARPDIAHRQVAWDGRTVSAWASELTGAVVVNLAGEIVDRRPTARNIELLRRSRVDPTRALVTASSQLSEPPVLWLQMSTLAIYGDAGQEVVDETHPSSSCGRGSSWTAALQHSTG
jgi:NAD dependent epimerase/dehydratase family enzyme